MIDFVFLHGGGQGSWVWAETIAALRLQGGERVGKVVALDVAGCGAKRDREVEGMRFDALIEDLIADLDASGLRDAVLVGHSQAGTVLPRLIEARGEIFRRAIYVSCSAPPPELSMLSFRDEEGLQEAAEMKARYPFDGAADPKLRYRALFCNDMGPEQAEAFLAKLGYDGWPAESYQVSGWRYDHLGAVPGRYVLCLQDAVLLPQWQAVYAERLRAERIIRIDAAHQVMNTRPQALGEVLLAEAAR